MVWVGLDEVVVAGVGVGQGERAGGDYGEVQDGGWGVGVSLLNNKSLHGYSASTTSSHPTQTTVPAAFLLP